MQLTLEIEIAKYLSDNIVVGATSVVLLNTFDNFIAEITIGGEVVAHDGTIIGFINADGSAGDAYKYIIQTHLSKQQFLGYLEDDILKNNRGKKVGSVNIKKGNICDPKGKIQFNISEKGVVSRDNEAICSFNPYTPDYFIIATAFITFFKVIQLKKRT